MSKVAIFIVNYNMPEATNALALHINNFVKYPHELFVIDNGSDITTPSRFTNVEIPENCQTTGGWLAGLDAARREGSWFAYWFLITSAEFVDEVDPLMPLVDYMLSDDQCVGVHPALTEDSTSDWPHLFDIGTGIPRETWHIDNIASLYRADWFDEIGGFDPRMRYAWGIDLDLGWKARAEKRTLYVHEGVRIKKTTDIAYRMNRMRMSAQQRRVNASREMARVLGDQYGNQYWKRVTGENVSVDMLMPGIHKKKERVSHWPG